MPTELIATEMNSHHPQRLLEVLDGFMTRSTEIHRSILDNQTTMLDALSALSNPIKSTASRQAVFSRSQLDEFACGSIARCFGSEYAILDQRPAPRIPNGQLLLIDRVTEISGQRMEIKPPASIVTEVDVPVNAWYLKHSPNAGVPLAVLMEMALQPCGILSAYLGTSLVIPPENHLFRNLDGAITLADQPDLRGETITNHAELIKSVASAGLYIQTYHFALSSGNSVFLEGESSFGYFTPTVMKNQSGLDLGEKRSRLIEAQNFAEGYLDIPQPNTGSALDLSEHIWVNPDGGRYGRGVVAGQRNVDPHDWYFSNHFYGDPVMPGSLGVEMIDRGLIDLIHQKVGGDSPHIMQMEFPSTTPFIWKYRGQVLPSNRQTYFEVHIKDMHSDINGMRFIAEADLWVDGLRIYTIDNLTLVLKEGTNDK